MISPAMTLESDLIHVSKNTAQLSTPTPIAIATLETNDQKIDQPPLPTIAIKLRTMTPSNRCTNRAEFVKNLTISDRTALGPIQPFAKIWRLKNVGTCTWTTAYSIAFYSGDVMGETLTAFLSQTVLPGEVVDLRLDLVSPALPSLYTGYWLLQDEIGQQFGLGPQADQPLVVAITVTEDKPKTDQSEEANGETDCT
jgi:hypothetical protein